VDALTIPIPSASNTNADSVRVVRVTSLKTGASVSLFQIRVEEGFAVCSR
jgi:hypothetical protein